MSPVRQLPPELVGKIAAGEVVERPSSVVKELVENSLDAGATSVEVEIEAGGIERIRVADDGSGMSAADAALAFAPHATSKIETFQDLVEVQSLGFRGEALSSIGAVAHVELHTAQGGLPTAESRGTSGEGVRVRVDGGKAHAPEPAPRGAGTTVDVASLFFNVPARRKFLKTAKTEQRRILEIVQGYALARPDVRFLVRSGRGTLLDALPCGDGSDGLRRRIGQLFGQVLAEHLLEISRSPVAGKTLWGFVGDQTTTRGRRYFTFVNRRLLQDRTLLSTFYRAVRETWKGHDFPALFLFLDLPAEDVDVNVHPQKAEVRFRDPRTMGLVFSGLRRALETGLGEVSAPLGSVAEGLSTNGEPGDSSAGLAWEGVGEIRESAAGRSAGLGLDGGGLGGSGVGHIAEAVFDPLERAPVPLTGRPSGSRSFRLLGQYRGTVILLEGPDALYLVDQHVAHERILYERLRSELGREAPESQRLLEPVLLELAPAERARLAERADELERCGFELTELSGGSLAVSAVPTVLKPGQAEKVLIELAHGGGGPREGELKDHLLDALAASLACRAAVKMHDRLSADQMEAVVAELFAADQPFVCPHGRPTMLKMTDRDLESRFGRR